MRNGTQEELDAARDDARLLPFNTVFKAKGHHKFPDGTLVVRGECEGIFNEDGFGDDDSSVAMQYVDNTDYWFISAGYLEPVND